MLEDLLRQASLTVATAASLLRRLSTATWLQGAELTVTVPAGETSAAALHGLGRSMNGAVVLGTTDASRTVSIDLSRDPLYVTVRLSSAAVADFQVKVRVH